MVIDDGMLQRYGTNGTRNIRGFSKYSDAVFVSLRELDCFTVVAVQRFVVFPQAHRRAAVWAVHRMATIADLCHIRDRTWLLKTRRVHIEGTTYPQL